jgi:hypothetical protein
VKQGGLLGADIVIDKVIHQLIRIYRCEINSPFQAFFRLLLDFKCQVMINVLRSYEDLYKHIDAELADYVGRESDTS